MTVKTTRYAEKTGVSESRSLEEIKATLRRFGATGFAFAEDETRVALLFVLSGGTPEERRVRFAMRLPAADDPEFRFVNVNQHATRDTTAEQRQKRLESERMRKYRALAAGIKAKVVMVEEGIETMEQAFFAHVLLPSGRTLHEETSERIAIAYRSGTMPDLLPGLPPAKALPAPNDEVSR